MKDALGAVQSVLVLGGTSDIGIAIASRLAAPRHATVVLAGRRENALRRAAAAVHTAGAARVETLPFDADDTNGHDEVLQAAATLAGTDLDVIVLAFGLLGEQARDEAGGDGAVRLARTNYVGTVSAGLAASRLLRRQGHGSLVVLSSVAGVRVRRANFLYGSSKAGVDGFAQGLADALAGSGVRVLTVRPGFVHTKMTAGRPPAPLATTADAVAAATARGLATGRQVVWVPAHLRLLFGALQLLPRCGVAPPAGVTSRRGVAAFDFDGTLVPGDSLPGFLTRLLGRVGFSCALAQAAPAMLLGYQRAGRDGSKAALLQRALAGYPGSRVAELGEEFGCRLADRIRPEMATRLAWHQGQGHRQVLVSASLAVYLEPFGRVAGFDEVIATRLETGPDGLLTGRLDGPNVRARQKALLLRATLGPGPVEVWAYGDSAGDREMLQMADHPTRIRHRRVRTG